MTPAIDPNALRIERILHKLQQVRQQKLPSFGSQSHGFKLNSPLDEEALLRFETEHGMILPDACRSFLKLAGNGGAGPYYGIFKLEKWEAFIEQVTDDVPNDVLALPCPLYPKMPRDNDWELRFPHCTSPYQGVIRIGTQGCSYEMGLIATGEYAGRVVYLDADGQAPYVVREPDFLSWYERWLDELLGGYDTDWFGYGISGDENSLMALLDTLDTTDNDRAEALYAIRRLPKLSQAGRQRMGPLLRDSLAEVRAAACSVIEKFAVAEFNSTLALLLHDPSSEVQKAATTACEKLQLDATRGATLGLLDAADESVAQRAFFTLNKHSAIARELLLRLAEFSPHGSIRSHAAHAVKWTQVDEDLLIRLLDDDETQVRFYAVLGLRQIASRKSLDAVIELLNRETSKHTVGSILHMLGEVAGPRNADILLTWAIGGDELHRLEAIDSLCKLGDMRVKPIAAQLLNENLPPKRVDPIGLSIISHSKSMRSLVAESLKASPNRQLRGLVATFRWPSWLLRHRKPGE